MQEQENCLIYISHTVTIVHFTVIAVVCVEPTIPDNVFIGEYNSTEDGAKINFSFKNDFSPNEWITASCLNSTWSPSPEQLVCTSPEGKKISRDYIYTLPPPLATCVTTPLKLISPFYFLS